MATDAVFTHILDSYLLKFGQLFVAVTAQSLLRSGAYMIGGILAGLFIDSTKNIFSDGPFSYRFIYVWQTVFLAPTLVFNYRVYRVWKRLGADDGYSAPTKNFSIGELLSRPPPQPAIGDAPAGMNRHLSWVVLIALGGLVIFDLVFLGYFTFFSRQSRDALVFGIQTGVMIALIPLYLKLLRFMERP
ncbi:MAG: hypothetical protein PHV34_11260 [Verrucomicrobiae bacterium]|nr:hypothetical protein [Verrucomicrobiae bacterium]